VIALWIAVFVVAAAVAAALARPLMTRGAPPAARAEYDLSVFRDQLAEIDRDAEDGLLDAAEADAARLEIQRRMLAADAELQVRARTEAQSGGRVRAAAIVGMVPVGALLVYLMLGSPEAPNAPYAARDTGAEKNQAAAHDGPGGQGMPVGQQAEMAAMVGRLAERLLKDPDNVDGWLLLGRSYLALERLPDALNAFERARTLAPGQPDVEIALAEAVILAAEMKVTQRAERILRGVHERDPFEPKSRYYLGLMKAQQGDVYGALQDWADLVALSPAEAPWVAVVRNQIARAANELNVDPAKVRPSADAQALLDARGMPAPEPAAPPLTAAPEEAQPAPGPSREQMEAAQSMSEEDRSAMIRGMVQRLADRMKEQPDDIEGWKRLERAYRVLGEPEKADEAQAQVKRLSR